MKKEGILMLNIIFEDDQILVCEKPSGVAVQSAGIGTMDLESRIKNYLSTQNKGKGEPYLGMIHRLDQPVGGVLVFAKTASAAAFLSKQTGNGEMDKWYQAVVCGKLPVNSGVLVDYLYKDGKTNTSRIVKKDQKGAKKAELHYTVLDEKEELSLLEIHLITGRHHQIRVQMAGAGTPLLGDKKYNPKADSGQKTTIGLYACKLSFIHPKTKQQMVFSSEPKGDAFSIFISQHTVDGSAVLHQ